MRVRLKSIEISHFKSFVGRNNLTPLAQWNAIKGPNGSGKSSLIDAITFGLGENDYSKMRINNLSELIPRTCGIRERILTYVSLTIASGDESTVFKRIVTNKDGRYGTLYAVDGIVVTAAHYLEKIKTYGINIEAKDFVIYQGNINDIIEASPKDRTKMLEIASGSIEFKERHDDLTKEIASVHQQVLTATADQKRLKNEIVGCKKALNNTREQEGLQTQYQELLKKYYLLQLKINDLQTETLGPDDPLVNAPSRIDEAKEESRFVEMTVKKIAETRDQLKRETQELDELRAESEKKKKLLSICKVEIKKLKDLIEDQEKLQASIEDREELIRDNEILLQNFSQDLAEQNENELLSEANIQEYHNLQTIIHQAEAVKLAATGSAGLSHLINESQSLKKAIAHLETDIPKREQLLEKDESALKVIQKSLKELSAELEAKKKLQLSDEQIKELETQKKEIEKELDLHEASLSNAQRMAKQKETMRRLKAEFPDKVYERLINLCRVHKKEDKIVMAAALDKNLYAIIVEDDETAIKCLDFLAANRMTFETFYSIKGVGSTTVDWRIETKLKIKPKPDLIYKFLRFDQQFERVFQRLLQSTVVCNTLDNAWIVMDRMRALQRQHNVVTKAGEVLTPRGTVSAGYTERKLQSEGIQTVSQSALETKREKIRKELERVHDGSLKAKIQDLDTECKFKANCEKKLAASIKDAGKTIENLQLKLVDLEKQLEENEKKIKDIHKKRADFKGEIDELRRTNFEDFCGRLGIENIEVFEVALEKKMKLTEEKQKSQTFLSELRHRKESEESRLKAEDVVRKWKKEVVKLEKEAKKLQSDLKKLEDEMKRVKSSIEELEGVLEKDRKTLNDIEAKRRGLFTQEHRNRRKSVQNARLRITFREARKEILLAAELNDVTLPEVPESDESSSDDDSPKRYDFISLDSDWQESEDVDHLKRELSTLDQEVKKIRKKIDEYVMPEGITSATLNTLEGEVKAVDAELSRLRKQERELNADLKEVKQQRADAFSSLFEKAMDVVDNVFKRMYDSEAAYANLTPENHDEPYLEGIRYSCTPARKRYRGDEKLSGGEKALAGLTFLFALQESRSSSLVILDEVDGALDPKFVKGFADYLVKLKHKHQIFMISHNDMITAQADTVICVTPDALSGELKSVPIMIDFAGKFGNRQSSST